MYLSWLLLWLYTWRSTEGQSTASGNLMRVLNLLNDDDVSRIGVWGMGGVGKTTLVKNLNNKLETATSSQPFSIIIWATVSKELDLERLQRQLLGRLNLAGKVGETKESTASRLHQRLKKEKSFLLILDDVWEAVDLDYLGVPQPGFHKGYKIILTSRSLDVCRQMRTDIEVKVDVLDEEESWQLFAQNAGKVASLEHIKPIAEEVCKECGGLPLAIIMVGASMRGKTMDALWKDALSAMRRSVPCIKGIEDNVYKPLKWSYDSLFFQGIDIKSCFLYCSLYPEDFSIQVREILQCWIAEGFVGELQNYEDSINRGIALVENLKDSCLLEDGTLENTVKMHDVVRDVAIWIASSLEDGFKSFVRSGIGLNQVSEFVMSKSLKRVSFKENNIKSLPYCTATCPNVSSLLLQGNMLLEKVPGGFLQGFQALKVLNLSGTCINTLPLPLLQLRELQALLLRNCRYLQELPPLGRLCRLEVLECSFTNLVSLPEGLEKLTNLRLLDLSETLSLRHIQKGIISQMSRLEIIDMRNSIYEWGAKREVEMGRAPFDDLRCLDQLSALYVNLNIWYLAFEDLTWIERLKRFHVFVGHPVAGRILEQKCDEKGATLRRVALSEIWVKWLLKTATHLLLYNCWKLEKMPTGPKEYCFNSLKLLTITDYRGIIPPARGGVVEFDLLPNLEELALCFVVHLESISELSHHLGLSFCEEFVELFENASSSQPSEEIEELVEHSTSSHILIPSSIFPHLQIMKLRELRKLTTLRRHHLSWQHIEQLGVVNCNLIKKLPFTSQNSNFIKEIRGELQWWNQLEWDDEDTKLSLQKYFNPVDANDPGF